MSDSEFRAMVFAWIMSLAAGFFNTYESRVSKVLRVWFALNAIYWFMMAAKRGA